VTRIYDAAIIGAGPAGVAAAIQMKRSGIDFIIFEKEAVGGLLKNANCVENYLGLAGGISGQEFLKLIQHQLKQLQIETVYEEIKEIEYKRDQFSLISNRNSYLCKYLVVASGTKPVKAENILIPDNCKESVFHEVHPLMSKSRKEVLVIGAGDAAFDYALNLGSRDNRVLILARGKKPRCLPLLHHRAMNNPNINFMTSSELIKISRLKKRKIFATIKTPEDTIFREFDYIIFAIGREPELGFISHKFTKKISKLLRKELIYLIGDVKNANLRQIAIAAGDGITAAMRIYNKLGEI
jgi:thioredoxin reductase (NADPH)